MRYITIEEAPEKVSKKEFIVYRPDFMEDINKATALHAKEKTTTLNRLRNIMIEIGNKFDQGFSAYSDINLTNFIGIPYNSNKELSEIVFKIINEQKPEIIDKNLEEQILKAKPDVELIYYVARDLRNTKAFSKRHIHLLDKKEIKKMQSNNDE